MMFVYNKHLDITISTETSTFCRPKEVHHYECVKNASLCKGQQKVIISMPMSAQIRNTAKGFSFYSNKQRRNNSTTSCTELTIRSSRVYFPLGSPNQMCGNVLKQVQHPATRNNKKIQKTKHIDKTSLLASKPYSSTKLIKSKSATDAT